MPADDREFYRLVAEARDPERLFPIQTNKYHGYYAGHLPDGTQVLVGRIRAEKILVLYFSKWGGLYDILRRKLAQFRRPPEAQHLAVNDSEFLDYLHKEFGFRPGLVRVQQFLVADDECGFSV